jgi:hypothetical protein
MTENNKTATTLFEGGDVTFVDIAALAIATALFVSQGDEKVLEHIGQMADALQEGFTNGEEKADEQQGN